MAIYINKGCSHQCFPRSFAKIFTTGLRFITPQVQFYCFIEIEVRTEIAGFEYFSQ